MRVKEIFYSIQGEGANTGRTAVFCRFAGCNLACEWCDTDFEGGYKYTELEVIEEIMRCWSGARALPFVIFTGGEPALQLTESIISEMRRLSFDVAVETNGTLPLPDGVYWRTVSPKAGSTLIQRNGNELKVPWPQDLDLNELLKLDFRHFFLQPIDGIPDSVEKTIEKVKKNPAWRLSMQIHKFGGFR